MADRSAGPEAQAAIGEQQEIVQSLLQSLPEEYRQTVILRYWYDMSYDEIAEVMNTTVSAIKSRLFRARRQLAETGLEMGVVPDTHQPVIT
jgi:RNA polymerase sigma-70 factor (ECF subfamily)